MAGHRHGRAVRVGVALCAIAICAVLAPAASAAGPVGKVVSQSPAAIRSYWTKERLQNAQPIESIASGLGLTPPATARVAKRGSQAQEMTHTRRFPYKANGRVFLTIPSGFDAGDYECSGTAVHSPNRSVVWTAGHCGYDSGNFPLFCDCFVTNFEFIPGYRNGSRPFGTWPATNIYTTNQWANSGDSSFDLSAAKVGRRNGKTLQATVRGRRLGFNQPRNKTYSAYGYPAEPPFNGQHQYRCRSPYAGSDTGSPPPIRIACNMTGGASGGGWIIKRGHKRRLVSVTSYGYGGDPNHLYGPYQGNVANSLWQRAGG